MLGVSGYGELDRDNPPLRTAQPLVPLAEWFDADSVLVRAHLANANVSKYARLVLKISPDGRVAECRHKRDPLPIFADESVHVAADIPRIADAFDGINIKLMKCGGIGEALRMIATARAHGMQIMLGCMVETSLAITAAAHLSPLVDFADLDGNLLVTNDPFVGATVVDGRLVLPEGPGLGVTPRG